MKFLPPLGLRPIVAWGLVCITFSNKLFQKTRQVKPSIDQLFNGTESPNIVDVLERLPPGGPLLFEKKDQAKKVAICVTGHLRTFIEPGVHSALAKNAVNQGVSVDTYIVGHLGKYGTPRPPRQVGALDYQRGLEYQDMHASDLENASSLAIQKAIKFAGLNTKETYITKGGDCAALLAAWRKAGVTGRRCGPNKNFMQVMWIDHCVHMVRKSGVVYDLILRTRPDVGVFQSINYNALPLNAVSAMPKDEGGGADWFFAFPMSLVDTWWDRIASLYAADAAGPLPDYTLFAPPFIRGALYVTQFPAVIIRTPTHVECFRLQDVGLERACYQLQASGYFGDKVH